MMETASSSFSVNVMARLPCLGTMSPTMKAPNGSFSDERENREKIPRQTEDRMDADDIGK